MIFVGSFDTFRTKLRYILAGFASDSGACVFIENSLQWKDDHVFASQELSSLCYIVVCCYVFYLNVRWRHWIERFLL